MRREIGSFVLVVLLAVTGNSWGSEFLADFDAYTPGVGVHGRDGWKGWDNVPAADARVSSLHAHSGRNSLQVLGTSDIVHEFDIAGGVVEFSAMQYIPSGSTGSTYFILLNTYNDGGPYDWSVQLKFDLDAGIVTAEAEGGNVTAQIVLNRWVELKFIIDLDGNTCAYYYGGALVASHRWDNDAHRTLQAIDLYGHDASPVYYDDIRIDKDGAQPTECCGLEPGDRVRLLVSNPNGAANLPAGTLGMVVCCYQMDGVTYVFITWDNWRNGTTFSEWCLPERLPDSSGWTVGCSQIEPVGTPPADCCGLEPGDRVRLLVSNPSGAVNLAAGTLGSVVCCGQGESGSFVFISWDHWLDGRTFVENCDPFVIMFSPSGWPIYSCSQIEPAGSTPPADCCGFAPGDRVLLLVNTPTDSLGQPAVGLYAGAKGTVICCDHDDPERPLFVSWDNWTNGKSNTSFCDPPVEPFTPYSGWWMKCAWIEKDSGSPPPATVDLYDAGESHRSFSPRKVTSGQAGQMMAIDCSIGNKGTGQAPTHKIRFYISADTRITVSDYFLAEELFSLPLAPGQVASMHAYQLEFPTNVPPGFYYIGWIIDPGNEVAETDESNNIAYKEGYRLEVTGLAAGEPDLVDAGESYRSFTPRTVEAGKPGQDITISCAIENQGTGPSGICTVRFYASRDNHITSSDYQLCQQPCPALDAGNTYFLFRVSDFPTTVPAGTYYVGWIIDADAQVAESNESNNAAFKQGYFLVVSSADTKPDLRDEGESSRGFMPQTVEAGKAGQTLLTWSSAVNAGTGDAGACRVRCYASPDTQITPSDALLAEVSLPALGAGASVALHTSQAFPTTIEAGTYYVGWIFDADNQVQESDENNNITYKQGYQLIVTEPSEPDLYDLGSAYHSVDPDPPMARIEHGTVTPATFQVSLKVGNQGKGDAATCTVRCYASTDTTITADDILLGQATVPALGENESTMVVIEAACPADTAQGFHTIGWIIDADDKVVETDEENNTGYMGRPQLLVHHPSPI